jgi:hypothetical protein
MNTSPGIDTLRTASLTLHDASPGLIHRVMVVIPIGDLPTLRSPKVLDETIKQIAGEYALEARVGFHERSVSVRLSRRSPSLEICEADSVARRNRRLTRGQVGTPWARRQPTSGSRSGRPGAACEVCSRRSEDRERGWP